MNPNNWKNLAAWKNMDKKEQKVHHPVEQLLLHVEHKFSICGPWNENLALEEQQFQNFNYCGTRQAKMYSEKEQTESKL
jgi:hypothetical protein